jgi:predicted acyl esterase
MLVSQNKIEDIHEAINKYPLWNSYWEDKKPRPDWINVPTYAVASWTHVIHSPGTIQAFAKIPKDTPKWLRVHNAMEWYDYYTDSSTQDLKRFFDYYLHGKDNGWLSTPPVRLSILNFGTEHKDMINRPEQEWPLARTQYQKLYLNDDKLAPSSDGQIESFVSYDAIKGAAVFRYTIPEDMETTGNFVAHLVMSCEGADDMDVHIQVETLKEHTHARLGTQTVRPENRLLSWVIDNLYERQIALSKVGALYDWGTNGKLRASHAVDRHPDFTPTEPVYTHKRTVPLKEGERRVLDIPLQPYGMYWKVSTCP